MAHPKSLHAPPAQEPALRPARARGIEAGLTFGILGGAIVIVGAWAAT